MKKIILNVLAIFFTISSFAQSAAEILKYHSPKQAVDSIAEALADLAMDNPQIRMAAAGVQAANYTWKASRFSILNSVFATGNLNEFTLHKQDPTNGRSLVYPRYNFGIRVSIGDFVNDPKIAKANRIRVEAENERLKQARMDVRTAVISAYQDYAMTQKLLALQEEVLQDEEVAVNKSEERFKNGEISLEAYTLQTKLYNGEQVKKVTLTRDLKVKHASLEALIGMPLSDAFDHISAILEQDTAVDRSKSSATPAPQK